MMTDNFKLDPNFRVVFRIKERECQTEFNILVSFHGAFAVKLVGIDTH